MLGYRGSQTASSPLPVWMASSGISKYQTRNTVGRSKRVAAAARAPPASSRTACAIATSLRLGSRPLVLSCSCSPGGQQTNFVDLRQRNTCRLIPWFAHRERRQVNSLPEFSFSFLIGGRHLRSRVEEHTCDSAIPMVKVMTAHHSEGGCRWRIISTNSTFEESN